MTYLLHRVGISILTSELRPACSLSDRGTAAAGIGRVEYLLEFGCFDQAAIHYDGRDALRIGYVCQGIPIEKVKISKLALFDGA
jgi:hypothetical protein